MVPKIKSYYNSFFIPQAVMRNIYPDIGAITFREALNCKYFLAVPQAAPVPVAICNIASRRDSCEKIKHE